MLFLEEKIIGKHALKRGRKRKRDELLNGDELFENLEFSSSINSSLTVKQWVSAIRDLQKTLCKVSPKLY
jgi:hypothetical protein